MPTRTLPLLWIVALVSALSACSVSGLLPDWTSADVAGPAPPYRYIIANHLNEIVGDPKHAGVFEISDMRRVESLKGASWQICIKAQNFPLLPRYYAVFIQREQIVDSRVSVLIDKCELEVYRTFDWLDEAKSPPAR